MFFAGISAQAQVLAFPTAEGYGKFATGGRGGEVVEVTNLLDDPSNPPEGSLRWALKQHKGKPITIVFRVSGVIDLKGNELRNNRSDITIAGQTAPGDGICIKGGCVNLGGSRNLIIRHIRSRVGVLDDTAYDPSTPPTSDQFIAGASLNIENGGNFIVDHCTFGWSAEENGGWYDNDNTTVQWCIFHEGLYQAGHGKGARSYGAVLGGKTATYHHNLLAHNKSRSPRFGATTKNDVVMLLDYVNNVNYNYGSKAACYGGDNRQGDKGLFQLNFVNNYYKPGPAYTGEKSMVFVGASYCNPSQGSQGKSYGKWHLSGNYMEGSYAESKGYNTNNYAGFDISAYQENVPGLTLADMKSEHIPVACPVKTESAQDAYNSVLAGAGAFPRDAVDTRIIEEVRTGTAQYYGTCDNGRAKGIINKPTDAGGYPTYKTYNEITDADHDGMDDAWELEHGLDPTNAADRNLVLKSGYTALEAYLNGLCGEEIAVEFARPYDIVVAQDGSGDYRSIQEALDAAPDNGERTRILVKNGTYEEKLFLGTRWAGTSKVVSLIGEDVDSTVITWDDYNGKEIEYPGKDGTIKADGSTCGTFTVNAPDFYMENITVCNPSKSAQAVALCQKGDRHVLKNCRILGNQDTHRTKKGRRYFYYKCTVEGGVDFIYAGGTCYFYQCNIVSNRNGFVTAPEDVPTQATLSTGKPLYYGFFFNDCDLTAKDGVAAGSCYLGRPWGEKSGSVFMNCRLGAHINAQGWEKMGDETWRDCSFMEYKSLTADGSALADVSRRASWSAQVSEDDRYYLMGLKQIYAAVNGKSTFDPLPVAAGLQAPTGLSVSGRSLTWNAVEGAECYAVYADGRLLDYAQVPAYYDIKTTGSPKYRVKAVGAYGDMSGFNGSATVATAAELDSILSPDYRVKLTLDVSDKNAGRATANPATPSYDKDALVTLTAENNYGYAFVQWQDETDSVLSRENPYTHKMGRETTVTAVFRRLPMYTLTLGKTATGGYAAQLPAGIVTVDAEPQTVAGETGYAEGHTLTLAVKDHPVYRFTGWSDGETALTRRLTMDGDKTLEARFEQGEFLAMWNFSQTQYDYYSADVNPADIYAEMNLIGEAGDYLSWDKAGEGYYGTTAIKNCATGKAYFDLDVMAEGQKTMYLWSKIKVEDKGYRRYLLEYSLDGGTEYTGFAKTDVAALDTWTTMSAELPAAALAEGSFRLRWIADYTSATLDGKTNADGTNGLVLSDVVLLPAQFTGLAKTQGAPRLGAARLYDMLGREYALDSATAADLAASAAAGTLNTLSLEGLPQGLYLLQVQTVNNETFTYKIKLP